MEAIVETGATAIVTDVNYDDTVRLAKEAAETNGWHLIKIPLGPDMKTCRVGSCKAIRPWQWKPTSS